MWPRNQAFTNPQFVGKVRPFVPRPKAIPVYSQKMIMAERGNGKFSTFSLKLLGPSPDFPNVSVNITLGSGTGVSFASLSPQEFANWLNEVTKWSNELLALVPNLQRQAEQLAAAKAAFDRNIAALKQAALQENMDFDGPDPSQYQFQ